MKKLTALMCAFSLSLWLAGCEQQTTTEPAPDDTTTPATGEPGDAGAPPAAHEEGGEGAAPAGEAPTEPAPAGEAGSTTEGGDAGATETP